jgi:uncharacterized protein (TIGR03067 family)
MIRPLAATALCAALALAVGSLRADDPPAGPKRLTNDELVKMVTKLGYDVKPLDKTFTQVVMERTGWRSVVSLSLSDDKTLVWFEAGFVTASFPDDVPAETWRKLLAKNDALQPLAFTFNKQRKRLYLMHSIQNADVTPVVLRTHLEAMDLVIEQTQPLWKLSNFVPSVSADGQKQLDALAGKWKVTEMSDQGKELSAEEAAKFGYTFDAGKFELLKDGKSIRRGQLVAATADGTKRLDRYDTNLSAHGIYKLDGDTLTWCYSPTARPTKFAGDTKTLTTLAVLRREK